MTHTTGEFEHKRLRMKWSFEEVDEHEAGKQWVFEVSFGDIAVRRRFSAPLSTAEALREAEVIAPELFRVAEAWLRESEEE
jgi:hypothetical protein